MPITQAVASPRRGSKRVPVGVELSGECKRDVLRITVVRRRCDQQAARPKRFETCSRPSVWVVDMLDHLEADDDIERRFADSREQPRFGDVDDESGVRVIVAGEGNARRAWIDSYNGEAGATEVARQGAVSAADVEEPSGPRQEFGERRL